MPAAGDLRGQRRVIELPKYLTGSSTGFSSELGFTLSSSAHGTGRLPKAGGTASTCSRSSPRSTPLASGKATGSCTTPCSPGALGADARAYRPRWRPWRRDPKGYAIRYGNGIGGYRIGYPATLNRVCHTPEEMDAGLIAHLERFGEYQRVNTVSDTLCHTTLTESVTGTLTDPVTETLTTDAPAPEPAPRAAGNVIGFRSAAAPRREGDPGGDYEFVGEVIRLTKRDDDRWRSAYSRIVDLRASLVSLDDWLLQFPEGSPQRQGWFHLVSGILRKRHEGLPAPRRAPPPSDDPPTHWAKLRLDGRP